MRLLIADSDPLILRSLEICFSRQNDFEVMGLIADGADAVDICKADNPDVVLLDTRLDGVRTTQQIKAHCPNTKVIMFSAFGNNHEVRQAINAGAAGYIAKTDEISCMIEEIKKLARC